MMGENQLLLNALVSILPSSLPYSSWTGKFRSVWYVVPYSKSFEMNFLVVRTLFSAFDINLLA